MMQAMVLAECKPGDIVEVVVDAVRSPRSEGVIPAGTRVQVAWLHRAHGDESGPPSYAAIRPEPFKGRPVVVLASSRCALELDYKAPTDVPKGEVDPMMKGATRLV